jgi:hypothetical protein
MDNSTPVVNPDFLNALKTLTERGFRPVYSCPDFALLSKPNHSSTLFIAQVTRDGKVNTRPLSEFLTEVLDEPHP